jgi:hypothetical protein
MAVNANLVRVPVKFEAGGKTYILSMPKGRTTGTLFAFMGYTAVGKDAPPAGAISISRNDAIESGIVMGLTAECKAADGRKTYPRILVPTSKVEETIAGGAGKVLGTATVSKIRSSKRRTLSI